MEIVRKVSRMKSLARQARREGRTLGFAPTMGALHAGHFSLVRRSREMADLTIVSVFVNPTQFGEGEDFRKYPRDLVRDAEACAKEGVDYVFAPEADEMYPDGFRTYVNVRGLSKFLCGASRVGHFRGVATVVAKLFHVVAPHFAFFGFKDAQQAVVVETMARDLDMDVEVVVCPTVREADGLAMSSRNAYLSPEERTRAACLFRALKAAEESAHAGERDADSLRRRMRVVVEAAGARLEYAEISHPRTLEPLVRLTDEHGGDALASVAARVGATRLIDNLLIRLPTL